MTVYGSFLICPFFSCVCVCVCVCRGKSNHTSSWSPTITVCNILANVIGTLVLFSCGLRSDIVSCCVKGIKVALQWCCKPSVCILSLCVCVCVFVCVCVCVVVYVCMGVYTCVMCAWCQLWAEH